MVAQLQKDYRKFKPKLAPHEETFFDNLMITLVKQAAAEHASDIFYVAGEPPVVESSGSCNKILIVNKKSASTEYLRISDDFVLYHFFKIVEKKMMVDIYLEELFETQFYTDFSAAIEGQRFRVNVAKQKGSFTMTMRLITGTIPDIDVLGLPPPYKSVLNNSTGLVLVVGPTGSGKSSSLASMIDSINNNPAKKKHIITLEDPIEYLYTSNHCLIEQKEMYQDIKSFPDGIRAALRQHPDIILVGEMRDAETIETTLKAAESGHLAFSTMHTNSAVNTINKILNNFTGTKQLQIKEELSDVLRAVFVQRLIPKKTQQGEKPGKILCMEICLVNDAIRNQIKDDISAIESSIGMSRDEGMILFDDYLLELYRKDLVIDSVVYEYSQKKETTMKRLKEIKESRR